MAEFGNYVIYLIMLGAVLGALASILRPESGLGREFVNGIHAIGPVFLAQAGIMVAIPYLSKAISHALGPFFQTLGSDVSIAALSIIAVDMGGYQLADALTANRDMWITAMLVGYTSGATIVYLIPVGLTMLERKDHKYLALGAMAGLISIPFAVLAALLLITLNHIPVRELVSTGSPALHYLSLDFLDMLRLLAPLFVKYREFYGMLSYPESSRKFLEKRLRRKESVIYLALADEEDRLLGFCQLYPSFSSLSLKRVWILNDIYVAEEARRQLVADHLLQHAKQMARETHAVRMRVSTSVDNEVAQKVYESIGFREDQEFKNYTLPISDELS